MQYVLQPQGAHPQHSTGHSTAAAAVCWQHQQHAHVIATYIYYYIADQPISHVGTAAGPCCLARYALEWCLIPPDLLLLLLWCIPHTSQPCCWIVVLHC